MIRTGRTEPSYPPRREFLSLLLLLSADVHGSSLDQIVCRPPSRKPHLQTVAPHRCSPATPRLPRHLHDPGTGPTPPSQHSFSTTACRSTHARLFLSYEPLRWTTGSLWHSPPFPLALDFAPHTPKLVLAATCVTIPGSLVCRPHRPSAMGLGQKPISRISVVINTRENRESDMLSYGLG